jgi:hypothetical protein
MPQTQFTWPDDDAPVQLPTAAPCPVLRFPEPVCDMPPALVEELARALAEAMVQQFEQEAIRKSAPPSGFAYRPDPLDGRDPLDGTE